jgi:hypothetical protein
MISAFKTIIALFAFAAALVLAGLHIVVTEIPVLWKNKMQ